VLDGAKQGTMELAVTREQLAAVRGARHVPEGLERVLAAARPRGEGEGHGYVLSLTYEDATALNELCSWNVHTDASGAVTPESRTFDDLVKAILTHPEY